MKARESRREDRDVGAEAQRPEHADRGMRVPVDDRHDPDPVQDRRVGDQARAEGQRRRAPRGQPLQPEQQECRARPGERHSEVDHPVTDRMGKAEEGDDRVARKPGEPAG